MRLTTLMRIIGTGWAMVVVLAAVAVGQQDARTPGSQGRPAVPPAELPSAGAMGQPSNRPLPACTKTITFAVAEGGQPVPAIPKYAAKWIGKSRHVEGYPDMCLSQMPSSKTANYIVIFSSSESSFDGLTPTAHTYSSTSPLSADAAGVSSYGGMWNYSYSGTLPKTATSSLDLAHIDSSKKELVLRAYDQQGNQVSHYNVESDHNREKVLEQVLTDIHRNVEKPNQRRIAAPFSVYYVNCDVDSPGPASLTASAGPPAATSDVKPTAAPPQQPTPQATLDLVSNPPGADIYLDDKYIGKTPFAATVAPGEHVVIMRKADYGTWGRKLQLVAGPRRVTAYLEQKFLTLPFSQPQTSQKSVQPRVVQPQSQQSGGAQSQPSVAGATVAKRDLGATQSK